MAISETKRVGSRRGFVRSHPTTAPGMSNLRGILHNLIKDLSEENYDRTFSQYRFWLDLGTTHGHIGSNQVNDDLKQIVWSNPLEADDEKLIHPTAHLFFRFTEDMKADKAMSERVSGFHERLCAEAVSSFFEENLNTNKMHREQAPTFGLTKHVNKSNMSQVQALFLTRTNLIARWTNLGYVKEAVIRNHILQSLISLPKLHDHQANALIILFTLAGATFGAYTDPSVIDRCFELLNGHYDIRDSAKRKLVDVCALCVVKGGRRLRGIFRRYPVSGRMVGKASLLRPYSQPGNQNRLAQTRKSPQQHPS